MSITSLKNKINKRIRVSDYRSDFQEIGSFIKKKRKELNVTQDAISNGICSISYLSKIENNQIIPNKYYVKEIMNKLDVEDSFYQKTLDDKLYLNNLIKGIFYLNDDLVLETYNEIKDIEHNLVINIVKLGYYIYFHKEDENQYVMMLENLVTNMNDLELKTYLYLATIYFISKEKYKTALEVLNLAAKISINNDYLSALVSEYTYLVKQRLLKKNCSLEDYQNAQNIYNKHHNIKRVIVLVLWKARYLSYENPDKALIILNLIKESLMDSSLRDFYYLIKSEILFIMEKYKDSALALNNINNQSDFFYQKMILLFSICKKEEDLGTSTEIKNILSSYKPDRFQLKHKVHYHYLLIESEEDLKEYLRDIAIPYSIKIEDFYGLKQYTMEMMDICMSTSRYKEATQFYKKYQKEVNRISNIMYD
ncbi:MAG: helix-turn-helix transcriptional regulator [Candidatus Izimaplasma sp.]|nr:helix-turn-helix transcriptional regulator [Candidatus Izimaplasma bacterium]